MVRPARVLSTLRKAKKIMRCERARAHIRGQAHWGVGRGTSEGELGLFVGITKGK